jgi:rubrerythrin
VSERLATAAERFASAVERLASAFETIAARMPGPVETWRCKCGFTIVRSMAGSVCPACGLHEEK